MSEHTPDPMHPSAYTPPPGSDDRRPTDRVPWKNIDQMSPDERAEHIATLKRWFPGPPDMTREVTDPTHSGSDDRKSPDRETVEHARAALEELATANRTARHEQHSDPVFQDIAARMAAIRHNVLADREHHIVADIVEVLARRLEALERRVGEIDREGTMTQRRIG